MTSHILVIDDDPVQRRLLRAAIERHEYTVHIAENGRLGLELLKRNVAPISVIVLDLMMPEMNGLEFLAALHDQGIDIPVIVQTGQGGIETVVQAMRAGAFDFVVKPVSPERIGVSIANALRLDHLEARAKAGRKPRNASVSFDDIVTASPPMLRVIDLAGRAALSTIPVVLEGESGVGKEMVARAIQHASDRADKPFVTVNCGAIPSNLVESILFGHEKGAFTGANDRHAGKFAEAHNGTLFLDEIGELPLDVQVKLLRAVQHGEIETIGARQAQKVNVRLISATNKDLVQEVRAGRFREDLYYRLNVFPISIPALRKRKEDVPVLVRTFVEQFSVEQGLERVVGVGAEAMALLMDYDWPGNIRQLENAVYRAVVLANGPELSIDDFPQIAAQMPGYEINEEGDFAFVGDQSGRNTLAVHSMPVRAVREMQPEETYQAQPQNIRHANPISAIASVDDGGHVRKLADVEEELIRFALNFYRGQMSEVARKLGIGRSTLYRKLRDYGIDPDDTQRKVA